MPDLTQMNADQLKAALDEIDRKMAWAASGLYASTRSERRGDIAHEHIPALTALARKLVAEQMAHDLATDAAIAQRDAAVAERDRLRAALNKILGESIRTNESLSDYARRLYRTAKDAIDGKAAPAAEAQP